MYSTNIFLIFTMHNESEKKSKQVVYLGKSVFKENQRR